MKSADLTSNLEPKDPIDASLHDVMNALSAARAYAEVLLLHARGGRSAPPDEVEAMLRELQRIGDIVRNVRRETYRAGDVLRCMSCGYTFTYRRKLGTSASCRRCSGTEVVHWKPGDDKVSEAPVGRL